MSIVDAEAEYAEPLEAEATTEETTGEAEDQGTDRQNMSAQERHQLLLRWADALQVPNIADELSEAELSEIGNRVIEETAIDDRSRESWLEMSRDAMDLAMQVVKARNGPWPNSSNVNYPLMSVAATQFAARAYPAIVADRSVVKGIIFGDDEGVRKVGPDGQPLVGQDGQPEWEVKPGAMRDRADRIGEHMSWQLTEEQPEWEDETDTLLHILPIVGSAFRKTYFDPAEGRNVSVLVQPRNFIVNYWAKSIYSAPRQTEVLELYPHEIEENKRAGVFLDVDFGPSAKASNDPDEKHEFYEQHRRLDLDCDGYSEPYIVTVHKASAKVARITARYDAEGVLFHKGQDKIVKILPVEYYTPYKFLPNPEGGIYGVGFGQLLGPINDQVNSTLNMLFDAGHLQNAGGGFIGKGLSMHSGMVKFKPGEYKMVNALGSTVRDAVVPLTFPGPSDTLFKLLGLLIDAGKDVASIKDVLTGEQMGSNVPATTILALIEQGLKVFTAIFKRVHRALKSEYDKLYRLNRLYLEEQSRYRIGNVWRRIKREDYQQSAGIEPVSDPRTVSDMQRLGRAEFLRQFIDDPMVNQIELHRRIFQAAGIEKLDQILVSEVPPNPKAIAEAAQLELNMIATKAKAIHEMAAAYKALAEGDSTAASIGISFVEQQMEMMRTRIEALDEEMNGNGGPNAAPAGPGDGRGPVPGMAPPPGNGALPAVPPGLLGGIGSGPPGAMEAGNRAA